MRPQFNNTFLAACRLQPTGHTPVWYMRQAGRYLPEYQKLRGKYPFLTICTTPELAAKVTLLPVEILSVDAAILFADIMLPLLGMGVKLKIVDSVGPVITTRIFKEKDLQQLKTLVPTQALPYLKETIQLVTRELKHKVPLIGFAAAPFTLASYLLEGQRTREFVKTKLFMYRNIVLWQRLMSKLTNAIIAYLSYQLEAGVQAIQLFDSWVGCLSAADYQEYVLPYSARIFQSLRRFHIPLIHFGTNTAAFLQTFASVECDVVGIDWRIGLDKAWREIGYDKAIQGNLDPVVLLSDFAQIKAKVDTIFAAVQGRRGFIFNLGHGVLPNTPLKNVLELTEYVHAQKEK